MPPKAPIIIGGHGRSGTTYMANVIFSHPKIVGQRGESYIFTKHHSFLRLIDLVSSRYQRSIPFVEYERLGKLLVRNYIVHLNKNIIKKHGGQDKVIKKMRLVNHGRYKKWNRTDLVFFNKHLKGRTQKTGFLRE